MSRTDRQLARQERKRTERDQRKALRRGGSARSSPAWLSTRNLTLGALAGGLIGVLVLVLVGGPAGRAELVEPTFRTPAALADGMALGSADAPLTIELWSDFQCPACAAFTRQIEPRLVSDYVDDSRVRLVYRDLAFLGPESQSAAIAARAAGQSGLFWQYHDYLFANQVPEHNVGNFSQARLEEIATAIGLDLVEFRAAQADPELRRAVDREQSLAAAAGISSTPTLIIGNERLTGVPASYADLAALIDQALAAGSN